MQCILKSRSFPIGATKGGKPTAKGKTPTKGGKPTAKSGKGKVNYTIYNSITCMLGLDINANVKVKLCKRSH